MRTECITKEVVFGSLGRRKIAGRFDGGRISSDGGGLLLRETEKRTGVLKRFAGCFRDHRKQSQIEHSVYSLTTQRVVGIALGYEDINDHDALRYDPLLAILCEAEDALGKKRKRERDKGFALAGKSTLNRLELTRPETDGKDRYKKIEVNPEKIDDLMMDIFLESFGGKPEEIILDADATDDRVHGEQEGRFYHGYYGHYCYLPLYIFSGEHLLCARLRGADKDASTGTIEEMEKLVRRIRARWPEVKIIVRGDSGFCRPDLMEWCEKKGVEYILGLQRNPRLRAEIAEEMEEAEKQCKDTGEAARVFKDFRYQTLKSWPHERRVVGKAEYLPGGENPRFVVTSLPTEEMGARALYEDLYCARGEMENRIKEQQLFLFADRTSCNEMEANQLRLYFSSIAYILMHALRRVGLKGTELSTAQCDTIRLKLFKIGALIRLSVRRIRIAFSESYPYSKLFRQVIENLRKVPIRV
jgi:Transposase DDE domain group 1